MTVVFISPIRVIVSPCCSYPDVVLSPLVAVTNPVDVIKTRLQLDNELVCSSVSEKRYQGMARGLVKIVSEEGIAALGKG